MWVGGKAWLCTRSHQRNCTGGALTPLRPPHGGESVNGLLQRVDGWLQQVTALPGRTVAVTHPAVVRAVLITTLRADASSFWRVDIGPLSATKLRWRAPSWTFQQVNAII